MTPPRLMSGERGFSLIEVLVAVVVLSVGLLALASLQSSLIRSAAASKAQTLAMAVAKHKIEQLSAVQSLGGTDNGCVSPTDWNLGEVSCYRAITDENADPVDGDPLTAGTQALGGIDFTVATAVTRFVFNVSTSLYASAADTALDSALVTSPESFLPGKEFKRIVVTVAWADPSGAPQTVQVEDVLNGIVPRDSIALLVNRRGWPVRKAETLITNPATVAGVIPIAVGNESTTAASNPSPELLGKNQSTYVAETRFDVFTYRPLDAGTALAQSRVETSVVGCRCDTETASESESSLRPTYWNGVEFAEPSVASYAPLAGPKAAAGSELPQSVQCRTCCRDHHDPSGDDSNGDPKSAFAKFSPRRPTHSHFLVNASGTRTAASSGPYSEVCRMIRVGGIFRVATDLHNEYFALLPASNAGLSSFAPSSEVGEDYAAMVKNFLDARITSEDDNTRYNDSRHDVTPAGPDPASYESGDRLLSDGTTRSFDLNLPPSYFLKLTADSRWLHARGLYIDYLTPEAIAKIDAAKTGCPTQPASNDCILPYLQFTSINLSELAEWKDIPIIPSSTPAGQVISVMNNGFKTATGDEAIVRGDASGLAATRTISFVDTLPAAVVAGMAVSGTGVADGARVTAVSNNTVTVDRDHTAAVGLSVTFQAPPVRGLASSGSAPFAGYAAFARATASYNNAAVALKFPMNAEDLPLSDNQRMQITASGAAPEASAGTFTVTGFRDAANALHPFGTPYPVLEWGLGASGAFSIDPCVRDGSPLPYLCLPTSGLAGPMRIRLSGYNVRVSKTENFTGTCTKGTSSIAVTGTTERPYCRNFDVLSAYATDALGIQAAVDASGSPPYTVMNEGKSAESTEIGFPLLNNNDVITLGLGANGETAGDFVSCTATNTNKFTILWTEPCQ